MFEYSLRQLFKNIESNNSKISVTNSNKGDPACGWDFLFVMTDIELIEGCLKEDRRCQNALYKRYFPLMSSIAVRYTPNPDDVIYRLNGGYLKILQNLHKYDAQFAFATFARNILVNYFIDEFRKEKKHLTNIEYTDIQEMESGMSYNEGEASMEAGELLLILKQLPDITGKVFNLFAIDGYKHHEISEMLGMSVGTSKWHVNEARRILKMIIEKNISNKSKEVKTILKQ